MGLADKYQDRRLADRVFELAWTHGQVLLRQLNATESDAQLYGRLASSIIYANASLRADPRVIIQNRRGQSGLWGYTISGDLPIVLLKIEDPENIELVRQLVQAHAYWRLNGLAVDLVIWNEDHAGYRQQLQDQIIGLVAAGIEPHVIERPGGIFVRAADQMADEDRILIQTVARVILADSRGTLAEQIAGRGPGSRRDAAAGADPGPARRAAARTGAAAARPACSTTAWAASRRTGANTSSPRHRGARTPAPWVNVLANPHFRHGGVRERAGQHLGRERARIPPHPLDQRPGRRPERRGDLPARRGARAVLVADAAAGAQHGCPTSPATASATPSSSTPSAGSAASCGSTWRWTPP